MALEGVSIRIHWLYLWKLSQVLETGRELSLCWHQVTTVPVPTGNLQGHQCQREREDEGLWQEMVHGRQTPGESKGLERWLSG